jgi:hypothetical protein
MSWVFISSDTTPNSINLICLVYLFPVIRLKILSTEYVLDIYQVDTTPNSIN